MKKNLLSGTFWLSAANLICKVLGIVYLIPWLMMMGTQRDGQQAQALYNVAYLPYALFLTLGTSGFPSGLAKKIAVLKTEAQRQQLFQSSLGLMALFGLVSGVALFVFAPLISQISPVSQPEQAVSAIRSLAPSLCLIPILSAVRGYYQGMSKMFPYSFSQIVEQVIRVIVILGGTFYFRVFSDGSVLAAVIISTFASFIGGLAALIYLVADGRRQGYFRLRTFLVGFSKLKQQKQLVYSLVKASLPFIYVGAAISLAQLVDQVTIKPILHSFTGLLTLGEVETLFTQAATNPNKLTALLISIVGALATTSLPLLSVVKNREEILKGSADTLRFTLTILLPAAAGMIVLAEPIYTILFGYDPAATGYLIVAILAAMILSVFTILFSILQSLGLNRVAVRLVTKALLIKILLQVPLVYFLQGYGLSLSTLAGFVLVTVEAYQIFCQKYDIHPLAYVRNYLKRITLAALLMTSICLPLQVVLSAKLAADSKIASLLMCFAVAVVGALLYISISFSRQLKQMHQQRKLKN